MKHNRAERIGGDIAANGPDQRSGGAGNLRPRLTAELQSFAGPVLQRLDAHLDARLVRTAAALLVIVLGHRNRPQSLWLTELGERLLDGRHGPAGVKRIWRLLRSPKWDAALIEQALLERADQAVQDAEASGQAFVVVDETGIEKPSARQLSGLTTIRSHVAARLRQASGGPPGRPVTVPGWGWVCAVVCGWTDQLALARVAPYSPTAPETPQRRREAERAVIGSLGERWGQRVIYLLDRGFGQHRCVAELLQQPARFIVRWRRDYHLLNAAGERRTASELTRRLRSRWFTEVYDPRRRQHLRVGFTAVPVWLPDHATTPLWLVVARRPTSRFWLLTTEDASTETGARTILRAYARRWQVEWTIRFEKADLGVASIRLHRWAARRKLWALVTLVHAFLLHLLRLPSAVREALLRWCHRTGQRPAQAQVPLYRLRHALANLWGPAPPTLVWAPP